MRAWLRVVHRSQVAVMKDLDCRVLPRAPKRNRVRCCQGVRKLSEQNGHVIIECDGGHTCERCGRFAGTKASLK
eukprot:13341029-Alexandrium_andersonii.AAC.1